MLQSAKIKEKVSVNLNPNYFFWCFELFRKDRLLGKYIGRNGKFLEIISEEDKDELFVLYAYENGRKKWKVEETENFVHLRSVESNNEQYFVHKNEITKDLRWKSKNDKNVIWKNVAIVTVNTVKWRKTDKYIQKEIRLKKILLCLVVKLQNFLKTFFLKIYRNKMFGGSNF